MTTGVAHDVSPSSCWYFAYGSNMNPARVRERGLSYCYLLPATLAGHQLFFNKTASPAGAGHANIEAAPGDRVEGVLYQLVDDNEIERMDPFERVPINYRRELVELATSLGPIQAWTYFANPTVVAADLLPKTAYLAHLLVGVPFVSVAYARGLAQQPTFDRSNSDAL